MKVEMRGLTKHFGSTVAVEDFTVTLEDGQLTSLLGPSGCGKSTVLNLLAGILPATRGEIFFDGEEVSQLPPELRGIGLVFQNYALYPHMTVLGNISFPLEIQKVPRAQREERARAMAALVHVDTLLHRKPKELSGGQQQRVAIARALVKNPNLLLLDEPLSNLDARLRLEMREEIRRIQQETQVTSVFVTHDQEEAMSISDRIVLMNQGRLQQEDEPQTLYNQPRNQFVADFLGTPPINHLPGQMKGGAFILEGGGASFPFPRGAGALEGRPLILAVRPESAHVPDPGEEALFSARVESVYAMGKEVLGYFGIGGHSFRLFLEGDMLPRPGTELPVAFKERGTFLFDRESGERLL
ncbi:MAG: ABC transporter ATP-binding protein [Clostridiales bacterium]|nr:ABC transporter ATP-binding protein [Clostridiales bacterium]